MTLYNEFDPFAADWLRQLVADNLIAQGTVDARDIRDIVPTELVGHRQVHLFAGIGVWSLALRLAGVPDDAEVWTASCPCQPFSAAGRRKGTADERHLWPAAFHLIRHCRPRVVMGEQVASPDGLAWLDVVLADLEAEGYSCRAVDLCAAGVGAPHIRQRLYWLAYASGEPGERNAGGVSQPQAEGGRQGELDGDLSQRHQHGGPACDVADAMPAGRTEGRTVAGDRQAAGVCGDDGMAHRQRRGLAQLEEPDGRADGLEQAVQSGHDAVRCGDACGMGHAHGIGEDPFRGVRGGPTAEREGVPADRRPGPTNGLWRNPDWLLCRDGKWRPVEPGTFPLASTGAFRNRVAELRGAGNAINVAQAEAFIRANIDVIQPKEPTNA